ncbi:MAG: hypothetical protein ABEK29_03435 [Bradymonadaceae bacterium]
MNADTRKEIVRQAAEEVGLTLAEDRVERLWHLPALAASAVTSGLRRDWPVLAVLATWTVIFAASAATGTGIVEWYRRVRTDPASGWTSGVVRVGRTLYVPDTYLEP